MTGALPAMSGDEQYGWQLNDAGDVGVSFHSTVFWRLDFDLGANAEDDLVEQMEVIPSADRLTKALALAPVTAEGAFELNPDRSVPGG